ncbi:hypothetical protein [Microbacterium aurantiacum]|uniref:Uncharacterized protein n=1 Tax=Microbacterium aurantiacum TaxID=162393 RepID=A0ABT8FRD1_9MICO|nr:hypothetical protein [Microbacterium aurantiacum]MDN4463877.1 hypothetical protein [Microbacterium aurantiacum]
MPTITGPILDSAGRPANGVLRVKASRPFDIGAGHITQTVGWATVRDGVPYLSSGAWSLPPTPDGVYLLLEQDLDGEQVNKFTIAVPDVQSMSYSELLFNRGGGEGGPNPYWWDLTGGLDFPPTAVDGDIGFDSNTGNVWRYEQ